MNDFEEIFVDLSQNQFTYPILFLIMAICIILLLREVRCWYWKINEKVSLHYQELSALHEIIELQKDENALLRNMIEKMDQENSGNVAETLEEAAPTKEETPE